MTPSQGDALTTALIPVACDLISAVHALDPDSVTIAIGQAALLAGNELDGLRALVVLLAGMCVEDYPAADVLAWTRNPDRYGQLRDDGVAALTASLRAARSNPQDGAA